MPRTRPNKLVAALVAALVGMPALSVPLMIAARSAPKPAPVLQLAILVRDARLRKRPRYAVIRSRLRRLLRAVGVRSRPHGLSMRPRLPPSESHARGPPAGWRRRGGQEPPRRAL